MLFRRLTSISLLVSGIVCASWWFRASARLTLAKPAPAKPAKLTMKSTGGYNLHASFGAQGRHHKSVVTVTLGGKGRCKVQDTGMTRETVYYQRQGWFKEEKTVWTTRWRGTWKRGVNRLELTLVRSSRVCDHTETWRNSAPKRLACPVAPARVTLICLASEVKYTARLGAPPTKEPAWSCEPKKPTTHMGGTSIPWLFGRNQCLQRNGGRGFKGRVSFGPCAP